MSVRIQTHVWNSALKHTSMLLMQAIGDISDDDGYAFPSNAYLSWKTGLGRSTVKSHMLEFRKKGYVRAAISSGSASNRIQIMLDTLPLKKQWERLKYRAPGQSGRERDPGQNLTGVQGTQVKCEPTQVKREPTQVRLPPRNKEEPSLHINTLSVPSKKPTERKKIPVAKNPNTDPRYFLFIDLIDQAHEYFFKSKPLFDEKTGIGLKRILRARKDLDEAKFRKILGHYHRSEDHNPTVQPGYYVQKLLNYEAGPVNQYGRPKDVKEVLPRSASAILDEQLKGNDE